MPNVLLGIPHGGTVKGKLLSTVVASLVQAPCPITFVEREGALGPDNRGMLAQLAVERDFTHLWLVDNDMTFPGDTLTRLLAHNLDLVGAAYNYRGFPARSVVKLLDETGAVTVPTPQQLPTNLFACYAIGSGCTLITTDALRRIPQPWFALEWGPSGQVVTSDDVWFCRQARSVGIETYCDPTLPVKHIGAHEY